MGQSNLRLQNISMALLAALPILAWYKIPFPVGLGYALVLFLSAYIIFQRDFKINVVPSSFWLVACYVSFMWMYHNHFSFKSIFPPGGWRFFIFLLAVIWGVITFDLRLLQKYMRWLVLVSIVLFWIQIIFLILYGANIICFVPDLTGAFTYEDMTYSELAAHQMHGLTPSSIFLEKSYMAYYLISFLAITWFDSRDKYMLANKEIFVIICTLIALRSGSGMIGLAVLSMAKLFVILRSAESGRRVVILAVLIPILIEGVTVYAKSQIGEALISRSDEFSREGSSGFDRVVGGYLMFEKLRSTEKLTGIPDSANKFRTVTSTGRLKFYVNGIQTILLSLGIIGVAAYLLFYSNLFVKVDLSSRICLLVLLTLSLLESNYLNPYMMLLTIIPCASYYRNKLSLLTE